MSRRAHRLSSKDLWNRPNDTVGLAEMLGGLGHAQQVYFNDGGLGILIRGRKTATLRTGEHN
jgi:hypothetical protein